jgi:hypothetical protein
MISYLVVPSSRVAIEDPANAPQLWDLGWLFLHNWEQPVSVSTGWRTSVETARSGAPQRRGAVIKPYRSITFTALALGRDDVQLLQSAKMRAATSGTLVPLYSDVTFLGSQVLFSWFDSSPGSYCGSSQKKISPIAAANVNGQASLPFSATTDGIVALIGADQTATDSYTDPVYDLTDPENPVLVTPGRVTITIPDDAIIFGQTQGDLQTRSLCTMRVTDGTNTFDLDASADGVAPANVGTTTADMAGFDVRPWSTAVPVADLQARGWVDENGVARMRLLLIASGQTFVDAQLNFSSLPVLPCETTGRRFFAGALIAVAERDSDRPRATKFEVAQIDHVTDTYLALKTPLSTFFARGSYVFPLLECDVATDVRLDPVTDTDVRATLTYRERVGKSQLPPMVQPGTIPDGMPSYQGYPVLYSSTPWRQPHLDWTQPLQSGVVRQLVTSPVGPDSITETYGDVPHQVLTRAHQSIDRQNAADLLRLFDSRAGALFPFFVVSATTVFEVAAVGASSIAVTAVGPARDWAYRHYIGVVTSGDELVVREIMSVVRDAGLDTVTLSDPLPVGLTVSAISRATLAHLVVSQSDELTEGWTTDHHLVASMVVEEATAERVVTIDVPELYSHDFLPAPPSPAPGGSALPPGPPVEYRQARDLCTGEFIDLWIPVASAPTYGGRDPVSTKCFRVDPADPTTTNPPGDVPAGWHPFDGPLDPLFIEYCECSRYRRATPCPGESGATFSILATLIDGGVVVKYGGTCYTVSETIYQNATGMIVNSGWTEYEDCTTCNPPHNCGCSGVFGHVITVRVTLSGGTGAKAVMNGTIDYVIWDGTGTAPTPPLGIASSQTIGNCHHSILRPQGASDPNLLLSTYLIMNPTGFHLSGNSNTDPDYGWNAPCGTSGTLTPASPPPASYPTFTYQVLPYP